MIPMAKLFWNKEKTKDSFNVLHKLAKELDFVLIGGWAVYYYTKQQESLDVDIAIQYDKLEYFRKFGINQYENTKIKYSIMDNIYIDIFLSEFSEKELLVPISFILKNYELIDGIKVVERNVLLILKLSGYFRSDETKVRKDVVDVISLLFYGNIDLSKIKELITKYKIEPRKSIDILLEYLDKSETLLDFIGIDKKEYSTKKKECKEKINKLFE
jgi:hypothetical protein